MTAGTGYTDPGFTRSDTIGLMEQSHSRVVDA